MKNFETELYASLKTSFIDGTYESSDELRPHLLLNNYRAGTKVLTNLIYELDNCDRFNFSVARIFFLFFVYYNCG